MKTALITGTSRGIGHATMEVFLEHGWRVIGTSTSGGSDRKDDNYQVYQLDLATKASIDRFVKKLKEEGSKIDVLVNNAAISGVRETQTDRGVDHETLQKVLTINLINTIYLTESIKPIMQRNGVVINISSEYGSLIEDWGYEYPEYRISKAAINMYTRNLYKDADITEKNIKVYSFDPGWVRTDMGGPDAPRDPKEPAVEIFDLVNSGKESGLFYKSGNVRDW